MNSRRYVQEVVRSHPNILVLSHSADHHTRQIRVTLAGERLSDAEVKAMEQRLAEYGFSNTELVVAQSGQVMPDINAVKKDILKDFIQSNQTEIVERETRIAALQKELGELRRAAASQLPLHDIYREISAQFPQALHVAVSGGYQSAESPAGASEKPAPRRPLLLVQLHLAKPLGAPEVQRLRVGLAVRAGLKNPDDVRVDVSIASSSTIKAKAGKR
jgi:hypothetical protein